MKDVCLPGVNMTPAAIPLLICDSRAAALRGEYLLSPRLSEQQQQGGDRLLSWQEMMRHVASNHTASFNKTTDAQNTTQFLGVEVCV